MFDVNYQDDLRTPGIRPSLAASRKQVRHMSKSRMYDRLRPQRKQRRTTRDANFGVRVDLTMVEVFAISLRKTPIRAYCYPTRTEE